MKRRRWILLIGLILLVCAWLYQARRRAPATEIGDTQRISPTKTKTLALIEERIRAEKERSSATQTVVHPTATPFKPGVPEKSCWEKIRDQYQTSPDYAALSRQRLNAIVGDWYYQKDPSSADTNLQESSPQGKFLLALAKAGCLEGIKIHQDDEAALALLRQVSEADPQNSAPLLYAAVIENRRGDTERANELLNAADETSRFDSYIKDFTFALFDGVRTPSDLLAAQEIWSTTPVPDYGALRKLLAQSHQAKIAQQMVEDGLRVDRDRLTDLSWTPIEYAVGKNVLDSFGMGTGIPGYRDLLREHSALSDVGVKTISDLEAKCDMSAIQNEVETVRSYLDQVRTKGL